METIRNSTFFAEIIESSLQKWKVQSWQWSTRPDFASLVAAQDSNNTLFGIISHIETSSGQLGRTPFPYQKTEEELMRECPHIFAFLQTHFTCFTLGYREHDKGILYQYAPQSPKIHTFVRPATPDEMKLFFSDNRYLTMLFNGNHEACLLDELLLGLIRLRIQHNLLSKEQLSGFIETFSLLIGNDYRRLKLFLNRIQPMIKEHHV